jgi:hypothetical protein
MGVVDYEFYSGGYMGKEADETSFPALCARASDVIGALTRWADETKILSLPARIQTLFKKAICAQIDFFALNGVETINETGSGGFTVGKVTVHGKQNSGGSSGGRAADAVSPQAVLYLEQTGLMNPNVPTVGDIPFYGGLF